MNNSTIIGVSAYDSKSASVHLIKQGKILDYGENLIPLSVLNIDDASVDFVAVINSDRTLNVDIGGIKFAFNNIKYDGFWGICNYSSDKINNK